MGHIRLKQLPASRKWDGVVALLTRDRPVADIAWASADAAEAALEAARHDPVLAHSLWLLSQVPLAARRPNFADALRSVGVEAGEAPGLLEIAAGFSEAAEDATRGVRGRTDLGEMARLSAVESLTTIVGQTLPTLFGSTADDVRHAIGRLSSPDGFAWLARDFFSRLTRRHLDYYLSRTLSGQVGRAGGSAISSRAEFDAALDLHCREAARIVEAFAGGWFSKTNYKGGITPQKAADFCFVALGKINAELKKRRPDGG
jgi:hypothetical protein